MTWLVIVGIVMLFWSVFLFMTVQEETDLFVAGFVVLLSLGCFISAVANT